MANYSQDRLRDHAKSLDILRSLGACDDAIKWVEEQPDQSPQVLWGSCPDPSWLAWYLGALGERDGRGSPAHRRAVLVACLCARTTSAHWRDPACERAVSLAERWAWDDSVTLVDLRASAYAAYAAHAAYYAAYYAAYAAAAHAAAAVACDAYAAAAASVAAVKYAAAAHAAAAFRRGLCDMIRAAIPEAPL